MTNDWFPVIDSGRCMDDCFACLNFCPQKVYEKQDRRPIISNPDNCLKGCNSCKDLCPKDAITFITTRTIDINGNKAGIIGLDKAFEMGDFERAFSFIREHNYIPDKAIDEYRKAIREEFEKKSKPTDE